MLRSQPDDRTACEPSLFRQPDSLRCSSYERHGRGAIADCHLSEEWLVQLSTARPEDDFTLQTVYDDKTQLVGTFEVETDDLPVFRRTLESIVYSATIDSEMLPPHRSRSNAA